MHCENYIFGKTAISECIRNDIKINLIIATAIDPNIQKLNPSIKWEIVPSNYFNKFNDVNHQYIIASIQQDIKHISINDLIKDLDKKEFSTILMIDGIEDPRNFGAIIRTAAAFNVDAIVYRNVNQAQINDLVIKTSIGGVYHLTFVKVSNLNQTINLLKEHNWWSYATNLCDESEEYNNCKFANKAIIIVGNENHGISKLLLKNSDFNIKITTNPSIQSLNVSVATGIILASRNLKN